MIAKVMFFLELGLLFGTFLAVPYVAYFWHPFGNLMGPFGLAFLAYAACTLLASRRTLPASFRGFGVVFGAIFVYF